MVRFPTWQLLGVCAVCSECQFDSHSHKFPRALRENYLLTSDMLSAEPMLYSLSERNCNLACCSLLAVVALSGGTGSALVAYLVASVFEDSTVLCIGKSAALQPEKLQRARFVADLLGAVQAAAETLVSCVSSLSLTLLKAWMFALSPQTISFLNCL